MRPLQARDRRYARKLEQAAARTRTDRVVVALVGVDAAQWVSAHLLADLVPALGLRGYGSRMSWPAMLADATTHLPVDIVAAVDPRAEIADPEIDALVASARGDVAAIPAQRAQDGTVAGLGAAETGGPAPWPILADHPAEDLDPLDDVLSVPLVHGLTVALGRTALRDVLEGDAPRSASAFARALRARLDARVLTSVRPVLDEPRLVFAEPRATGTGSSRDRSTAADIVTAAGFDVVSWRPDAAGTVEPVRRWRRPHPDAQRWAIKICAPAGRQGAVWGDMHFARGLASALRRRGHTVVIDAFDARARPTSVLDDVSVVVRGPYRIDPVETGITLQWIISHPDQITRAELASFDRVFAASESWSRNVREKWGIDVRPLLEGTDVDLFHPTGVARTDDIVFVGTARGIARPSVVAPLRAGIPVRVYGPDWRPFIPQAAIAARTLPHADLPRRYESASVVLNDQWPAMRRHGFIAMRPFDVVAVGGRVISEQVEGIEEIFGGAVITYRDAEHLVELLRADPDTLFPDTAALAGIAERIRAEHSFDARAAVLDAAAREVAGRSATSG
ncbi:glycosyltransferase family protein [Microbacterium trichothecenolyticum]|uniref:Spore maturation protein CgeB n=1 Tax=Microbacterium trichothecenolyticum TaxID=69370 RepID=A0ABU0TTI2_MICTR|nr:glycosyltransferase [Microbacterium trichothecenolyticum]MDQ1122980.1 spore maturation protein CgeB [Microbacterium trichothecenolyticum]